MENTNMESQLESIEMDIEELIETKEQQEDRLSIIESSIEKLEYDSKVIEELNKNGEKASNQLQATQQSIETKKQEVEQLQNQLHDMFQETANDMSVINELKSIGEDVSESEAILNSRQEQMKLYQQKLESIYEKLNMNSSTQIEASNVIYSKSYEDRLNKLYQKENNDHFLLNDFSGNIEQNALVNQEATFEKKNQKKIESASERSDQIINFHNNLLNNTQLDSSSEGYMLVAKELSSEIQENIKDLNEEKKKFLEKENEIRSQISMIQGNDERANQEYMEHMRELHKVSNQRKDIQQKMSELENANLILSFEQNEKYDGYRVEMYHNEKISEMYDSIIQKQGDVYDDVIEDCGICTVANMAAINGMQIDEKTGVDIAIENGFMTYNKIHDGMSYDEARHAMITNGNTSIKNQCDMLNYLGFDSKVYRGGASFEEIEYHVSKGDVISLNINGANLTKKHSIFSSLWNKKTANHSVMVTGIARDKNNKAIGVFINDTGGFAGDSSMIYLTKKEFKRMMKSTRRASSIVCLERGQNA